MPTVTKEGVNFNIDEQRAMVADKMKFDLMLGLRGILGDRAQDKAMWDKEAREVINVLITRLPPAE